MVEKQSTNLQRMQSSTEGEKSEKPLHVPTEMRRFASALPDLEGLMDKNESLYVEDAKQRLYSDEQIQNQISQIQ